MGNSCCHPESPCGSAEERSGLLKDDSKAAAPTGETVVGACGPEENDDTRNTFDEASLKVGDKALLVNPKDGESEQFTTQENGPLQKESLQTATPEVKENSNRAQDVNVNKSAADAEPDEHLQCTLNSLQRAHTAAVWEVPAAATAAPEEEKQVQEKILNGISQTAEVVCPEKASLTETNTKPEHITMDSTNNNNDEGAGDGHKKTVDKSADEPSGKTSQNDEELLMPNTQLTAAGGQVSPISAISPELNTEAPSCAAEDDCDRRSPPMCMEANPEDVQSHDVPESSVGPASTGLDHSGVETGHPANSAKDPVTAAAVDASKSSDQVQKCNAPSNSKETDSSEITQINSEETKPEVQVGDDEEVPSAEQEDKVEEAEGVSTEAGNDIQTNGKEQHVAEGASTDVTPDAVPLTEKEEPSEDGLGDSEEDLYRGPEELSAASQTTTAAPTPLSETTLLKVEDRCSLAPAVDILSYSEREWKGNTAKSALIRKGYKEMSQRFSSLRRVRGDNYCALRATLYQVLCHSTQLPVWLQDDDITMLPKELEARDGLISQWTFPGECVQGDGTGDAAQQLKGYMELLRNKVEMFLLGYALQCTIQVYRLYKADTEEFVTFYPDDHKDDWPSVCLVTEDDRHYNVPVVEAADLPEELDSS
ncbi:uncharacterized protein LOC115411133 isoform X2 [Sphaeramia orbicularis]|uniref:uncharacterized protein LOC115411133 isoform X2 n=1 Tax=Sphaeramia orbicularis TaxID=375764 RepID=UPI00117FC8E9|nr:uncharacterized protein LOC115411133 isoform X2 [Sphaeramia orbicularis]